MKNRPAHALFTLCAACMAFMFCTAASPFPFLAPSQDNAVGVLIPLSGKWESVGQKILRGILTAEGVFSRDQASDVQFIFRDYGGSEDSIPPILDELERDHSIVAVIGPVGERASEIACREAQKRGLPFIMFTQAEMAPGEETYCFRNFITIEMQARALLGAARSMGITRFGIMSPDDHFGATFTEKFQRLAPSFGIQVVRTRVYPLQKVDYKQELTALFSGLKKSPAQGRPGDLEAVLVPDSAQNAAVIASYISYLKIKNVRLFGPTLWDSPEFLKVGGRYVEDAVFLSGFYQGSVMSAVRNFTGVFQDTFHAQPSVWEACAYDTARIVQGFLHANGSSRADLRAYLAGIRRFDGASGITSFAPDGTLEKSIHLLTVQNGVVQEIHP
ncbi:MAG TPA: penicillin-binding protein activator [Deltaproteobacteria bacterium]|nr:penicillin-binding protein activator [Deltaproteobacteria bacterium]HPR55768.1 penicillin-binding protein activator [Deltaproteobacteria bacterium]HXK47516.1 penicillin-binding protein activator [Deltaproteobacteria bacterium]